MMKKNFTLLMFALLLTASANAQDWTSAVYKYGTIYPGYVITADGKKLEGFIKYNNRYSLQNNLEFYTDKDDRKTKEKFKTSTLKEYMVADKLYHVIHYSGGLMAKPMRGNLVVKEGCIMEYVWYDKIERAEFATKSSSETEEEFYNRIYPPKVVYLKQGEEDAHDLSYFALKFSKKMAELTSDNAEISEKVANKEKGYKMLGLLNIIEEYNAACAAK